LLKGVCPRQGWAVRSQGSELEGKARMLGRGCRRPWALPHPQRAGRLLWKKNSRRSTCSLKSFFPGSQPDYHQPGCLEEPSGDGNILLNIFSGKDRHNGVGWSRSGSLF